MKMLAIYFAPLGIRVRYVYNVYGHALQPHIRHANVVLNLHYFSRDISYLETYRLNELLAHRVAIVSEKPSIVDQSSMKRYNASGIEFVDSIRDDVHTDHVGLMRMAVIIEHLVREPWRRQLAIRKGKRFVTNTANEFSRTIRSGLERIR